MKIRTLLACMLVVSSSRMDINLEETVGRHELSVVPRSLFTADGQMLHSQVKRNLLTILENLPDKEEVQGCSCHLPEEAIDKKRRVSPNYTY